MIVPAWRSDVDANWFSDPEAVDESAKNFMHVYDRSNPPKGEGWVVQIVGHHYNPTYIPKKMKPEEEKASLGPTRYLQYKVLPRFWAPTLRALGITHATVTWLPTPDTAWTSEKTVGANIMAPLLGPEVASTAGATGAGNGEEGEGIGGGGGGGRGATSFAGMGGGGMGSMAMGGGGRGGMGGRAGSMQSMLGSMGAVGYGQGATGKNKPPELKTLTRTDFKIEFVWQPPKVGEPTKDPNEILTALREAVKNSKGAATVDGATAAPVDETKLEAASVEKSAKLLQQRTGGEDAAPTAPNPPAAPTPPAPPATPK